MIIKYFILLLLIVLPIKNVFAGETRVFVRDLGETYLKITNTGDETIADMPVEFPFNPLTITQAVPEISYPLGFKFYNSLGEYHQYGISYGQEPTFYTIGSITKHFTYYPTVSNGQVTLSNPETGEVFLTTETDSNGGFEIITTNLPSDLHEFTKISVTGGRAIVKMRSNDNQMVALVRTDSFSRGSVTVSMPTTAAYLAINKQVENISTEDYYSAYKINLNRVTRAFYDDVSEWPYETAYLNVNEPKPLTEAHSIDNQDLFTKVVTGAEHTLLDLMTVPFAEQIKGLETYFSSLEGYDKAIHTELFKTRPLEITIIGEGYVSIKRQIVDDNFKKTVLQDEIVRGIQTQSSPSVYKIPKMIVGKNEDIYIKSISDEGWQPLMWGGCEDESLSYCVPSEYSDEVVLYLEPNPDSHAIESKPLDTDVFLLDNDYFVGIEGSAFEDLSVISSLSIGEHIHTKQLKTYLVEDVFVPADTSDDARAFKVKVSRVYNPYFDGGVERSLESNFDYWKYYMGNEDYESGVIIPLKWFPEEGRGEGLFTQENMHSSELVYGEFFTGTEEQAVFSQFNISANSVGDSKTCYSGNIKSPIEVPDNVDLSVVYEVCLDPELKFETGMVTYQKTYLGGIYSVPLVFSGNLEVSLSGEGGFSTLNTPAFNPVISFKGKAEVDKLTMGGEVDGTVKIVQILNLPIAAYPEEAFLNPKNYTLDFKNAGASGEISGGFHIVGGVSGLGISSGITVSASIENLRHKLDENNVCGPMSLIGLSAKGKLAFDLKAELFSLGDLSKKFDLGTLFDEPFSLGETPYSQEEIDNCLRPSMTIVDSTPDVMEINDYRVVNNTTFTLTNNSSLVATVYVKTDDAFITPNSEKIVLQPLSSTLVTLIPSSKRLIMLGNGYGSVKTTFETSFSNEKGLHSKNGKKTLITDYLVSSSDQELLVMAIEEINIKEYMFGYALIDTISFGLEIDSGYNGHWSTFGKYNFWENLIIALQNRKIKYMKTYGAHRYSNWVENLEPEDVIIDPLLISITSIIHNDDYELNNSPKIIDIRGPGRGDVELSNMHMTDRKWGSQKHHRTIVEYGIDEVKVTLNHPDWFNPGTQNRLAEIFNTPYLFSITPQLPGDLNIDYLQKYYDIFAEVRCVDDDDEVTVSVVDVKKGESYGNVSGYSNGVYYSATSDYQCYYGNCDFGVKISSSRTMTPSRNGVFGSDYGSCTISGRMSFGTL
jgi:hypothetical protein